MGTRANPGKFDCYQTAKPDEPIFILLARDPHAVQVVRYWASLRWRAIIDGKKPQTDMEMVIEAQDCANAMERYRNENNG